MFQQETRCNDLHLEIRVATPDDIWVFRFWGFFQNDKDITLFSPKNDGKGWEFWRYLTHTKNTNILYHTMSLWQDHWISTFATNQPMLISKDLTLKGKLYLDLPSV